MALFSMYWCSIIGSSKSLGREEGDDALELSGEIG